MAEETRLLFHIQIGPPFTVQGFACAAKTSRNASVNFLDRSQIKDVLQRLGLFPLARVAYRALSPGIRKQHNREIAFYRELLNDSCLCFDIGANLGQKSEVFLACGARVVVVEPNALCQPTLRYLFGRNPQAEIVETAVGNASGFIDLHVHGTEATASVRPEWDQKVFGILRPGSSMQVPISTLDTLIARFGRPDFIKIDVEGYELDVLRGLSSRVPLLSFEFHGSEIQRLSECLDVLKRLGTLSIRASTMHCDWLGPKTEDVESCLNGIERAGLSGDLFVWIH